MIVHVTTARVVDPHSLEIVFDKSARKCVNLRRVPHGPVFETLRGPAQFARVFVDHDSGTVTLHTGADFAPYYLRALEEESKAELASS